MMMVMMVICNVFGMIDYTLSLYQMHTFRGRKSPHRDLQCGRINNHPAQVVKCYC